MFYTIKLDKDKAKEANAVYTFTISSPFESYLLSFPEAYTSPSIRDGEFDYFTYDESSDQYRFFNSNGLDLQITPNAELLTECKNCLAYYHSVFDADAIQRAKDRVTYHLQQTFPFKEFFCESLFFTSSYGFRVKGDYYFKDYLRESVEYLEETETLDLIDYDGNSHTLTREQLQHLLKELGKNQIFIEKQRTDYLAQINNCISVVELNKLQEKGFTYEMKSFAPLLG